MLAQILHVPSFETLAFYTSSQQKQCERHIPLMMRLTPTPLHAPFKLSKQNSLFLLLSALRAFFIAVIYILLIFNTMVVKVKIYRLTEMRRKNLNEMILWFSFWKQLQCFCFLPPPSVFLLFLPFSKFSFLSVGYINMSKCSWPQGIDRAN